MSDSIEISNVTQTNYISKKYISCFSASASTIKITDFHSRNITCIFCSGAAFQVLNYEHLEIRDSSFNQSTGYIGGALYSNSNLDYSKFTLINTTFVENKAS